MNKETICADDMFRYSKNIIITQKAEVFLEILYQNLDT